MNLPLTIEALVKQHGYFEDLVHQDYILAVAHEACRLQRRADTTAWALHYHGNPAPFDEDSDAPFTDPLVVEKP